MSSTNTKNDLKVYIESIKGMSTSLKKRVYTSLINAGITHPLGFKNRTVKELEKIDGISTATAEKIIEKTNPSSVSEISLFKSLGEKKQEEQKKKLILTGSKRLNRLLGGGIPLGSFVEFYGSPQSGKTQICYTASAYTLLPEEAGGLNAGVLWLDTEGSFNSKRLEQIITFLKHKSGLDDYPIDLDRFNVANIRTLNQMEIALKQAESIISKNETKLLVVDSLMDIFRAEYGGLGELATRQKHLNKVIHTMMKLADTYNIAVIYTNQVMANPDPFATAMDKVQPVGGFILGHASDIRIWLRRALSKTRKEYDAPTARRAMISDCGWLPMDETNFSIGVFGICDLEEEREHKELYNKLIENKMDE